MLRPARIIIESCAAFFITAALMDYGMRCTAIGRWFMSLQLVPAALALTLPVLALWIGITLMFGRVYCSTVCPLGAVMDLMSRARPANKVYRYKRGLSGLRAVSITIFALLLATGWIFPRRWLEPFGLYESIVADLTCGRVAAATFIAAAITGVIAAVAYRRGRLLCNTLCPVGALLGFFSRRSALHIDINTDRCTQCRKCVDVCKSECIDLNDHVADMSRCVVCFNCLPVCPNDAIAYTVNRHTLSTPLMQQIPKLNTEKPRILCNNTSTSSKTSCTTELSKPTAPEREH